MLTSSAQISLSFYSSAQISFYHELDMRTVQEAGPWSFDKSLLVLHAMQPLEDMMTVPLHKVDFWVHICGLTAEFYSKVVGRAVGAFLREFIAYDERNYYSAAMRIRVRLDVRKSLKREKPIRKPGKEIVVRFQYERLPNFLLYLRTHGSH
ncbi:hypothetical protein LINPERHAP1_LOCUS7346 [Linum perenne]